jgi:hypothetical protein
VRLSAQTSTSAGSRLRRLRGRRDFDHRTISLGQDNHGFSSLARRPGTRRRSDPRGQQRTQCRPAGVGMGVARATRSVAHLLLQRPQRAPHRRALATNRAGVTLLLGHLQSPRHHRGDRVSAVPAAGLDRDGPTRRPWTPRLDPDARCSRNSHPYRGNPARSTPAHLPTDPPPGDAARTPALGRRAGSYSREQQGAPA